MGGCRSMAWCILACSVVTVTGSATTQSCVNINCTSQTLQCAEDHIVTIKRAEYRSCNSEGDSDTCESKHPKCCERVNNKTESFNDGEKNKVMEKCFRKQVCNIDVLHTDIKDFKFKFSVLRYDCIRVGGQGAHVTVIVVSTMFVVLLIAAVMAMIWKRDWWLPLLQNKSCLKRTPAAPILVAAHNYDYITINPSNRVDEGMSEAVRGRQNQYGYDVNVMRRDSSRVGLQYDTTASAANSIKHLEKKTENPPGTDVTYGFDRLEKVHPSIVVQNQYDTACITPHPRSPVSMETCSNGYNFLASPVAAKVIQNEYDHGIAEGCQPSQSSGGSDVLYDVPLVRKCTAKMPPKSRTGVTNGDNYYMLAGPLTPGLSSTGVKSVDSKKTGSKPA